MGILKAFRETHLNEISRGESIYIGMAKDAGIEPLKALNSLTSKLGSPWDEPEYFLADLGKDDILAIIEARKHFHLPPLE